METYINYNGFGICYSTFGGTTTVNQSGLEIKEFKALGEMNGRKKAKNYIDLLLLNTYYENKNS